VIVQSLNEMLTHLKLPFHFDPGLLQADLEHLSPGDWVPHFNTSIYEGEWSGVALRAAGAGRLSIYPDPSATAQFADTEILARCPYYREVLKSFACPLTSARLLNLKARSSIAEHRDFGLGYEDGEARLHIPIVTNPAVAFFVEGLRVVMAEGECWYIDVNQKHRVDNTSDTDRIHLVIDCVVDHWLAGFFPAELEQARQARQSMSNLNVSR
jgi:hypothetical protein